MSISNTEGNFTNGPPTEALPSDRTVGADLGVSLAPESVPPLSSRPVCVPGYEVLDEVGRGAMGVVYKARQLSLNRIVALKMILAGGHASPGELARFRAEAEAVGQLQHPNIVQIFEVGQQDGLPFFAMEYVEGGTLAQHLGGKPQQPRGSAQLLEALARAMACAHEKGVIHRDLKPGNVMLADLAAELGSARDGATPRADAPNGARRLNELAPKIADFGLAKRQEGTSHLTQTGAIVGTPSYMAPEQAQGKKDVGPAADVYALGAILYECLTGRPPFQGPTALDTVLQVTSQEPVPVRRPQPSCPRDLETIVLKCLHKGPERRYASATDLADDLANFLADRPIAARPVGRLERGWRLCRRNPVVAAMTASVAVLLLALAAGASVAALWLGRERDLAQNSEAEARAQQGRAEGAESQLTDQLAKTQQAERDKTEKLWQSHLDRARAGRFSQRPGQRFDSLAALAEAVKIRLGPRLRDEAIACLALPDVHVAEEWNVPPGARGMGFDDERKLMIFWDDKGAVRVRRLAGGAEIAHLRGPARPAVRAVASPDGAFLLADWGAGRAGLWKLGRDRPIRRLDGPAIEDLHFSADSRRLVVRIAGGVTSLYELPTGRRLRQLRGLPINGPWALHPRGTHLAVTGAGSIHVLDWEKGAWGANVPFTGSIARLAWSSEGDSLLVTMFGGRGIYRYDATTGRQLQWIDTIVSGHLAFEVGRTGDVLACTELWAGGIKLWHPRTGRHLLSMPAPYVAFSRATADGRVWAEERVNQRVRVWEVVPGREYRTLLRRPQAGPTGYRSLAISPNGKWLAAGTTAGVGLWHLASGEEVGFLTLGSTSSVHFDRATGALLAYTLSGLSRWRFQEGPAGLRVSLDEVLDGAGADGPFDLSADGRVVALAAFTQVRAHHAARPGRPVLIQGLNNVRAIAVSVDGRYVATGCHGEGGAHVWDALTGALVKAIPASAACYVAFSPDGKWLATGGNSARLWEVGTWKAGASLGGCSSTAAASRPTARSWRWRPGTARFGSWRRRRARNWRGSPRPTRTELPRERPTCWCSAPTAASLPSPAWIIRRCTSGTCAPSAHNWRRSASTGKRSPTSPRPPLGLSSRHARRSTTGAPSACCRSSAYRPGLGASSRPPRSRSGSTN